MEIKLRPWRIEDVDSMAHHANNYNIAKFLTNRFPHPYTKEDAEEYITLVSNENPTKVFAIEVDGKAVGSIGIFPQTDIHEKNAEIGYWLSEEYWGKGIMPEAIKMIVRYGFETFDIYRIFAGPFATNNGSQRALQKAGFTFEARLTSALFKNGEYIDEMIYSIRKDHCELN